MNHYRKYFIYLSFIFLYFPLTFLLAQEECKGLIFNEVYLDKDNPGNSWIEIYNPTENALTLEAIRYSHIKTTNMLPDSIQKSGGVVINPGDYLIITSTKENFSLAVKSKNLLLPDISNFDLGGFMALTTKKIGISGIDAFKYGDPDKSAGFKNYKDKPLINFSTNGKSFSRKLDNNNGIISVSDFYETEPTKGSANK
ncbi:MAG: lamin tail domain-containing protein [Kosmotogaceae bacterium]